MPTDRNIDALFERLGAEGGPTSQADLDAARAELDGSSWATGSALTDAFADVAIGVDVADAVLAELALDAPMGVGPAVWDAAGSVDVADAVMASLDVEVLPVGRAVREAAGPVHLADAVMASLASQATRPVTPVAPAPLHPSAANTVRWFTLVALAAAALLVVGLGGWFGTVPADSDGLASIGFAPDEAMVFASAAEVQIEDLSFGEDVVVFQDEGADGALILWVDEEVL